MCRGLPFEHKSTNLQDNKSNSSSILSNINYDKCPKPQHPKAYLKLNTNVHHLFTSHTIYSFVGKLFSCIQSYTVTRSPGMSQKN